MKRRQNKHRHKIVFKKKHILKVGSLTIGPSTLSKVIRSQDKD